MGGQVDSFASRSLNGKGAVKTVQYRYLVSTEVSLSVQTIAQFYAVRWEIETFHAQAKELLGLDHNQCWRERNVQRLWTLLLIAYSYLVCEQVEQAELYNAGKAELATLGQVVSWHKREAHRGQVEWVYSQAQAGVPLEQLLDLIAA